MLAKFAVCNLNFAAISENFAWVSFYIPRILLVWTASCYGTFKIKRVKLYFSWNIAVILVNFGWDLFYIISFIANHFSVDGLTTPLPIMVRSDTSDSCWIRCKIQLIQRFWNSFVWFEFGNDFRRFSLEIKRTTHFGDMCWNRGDIETKYSKYSEIGIVMCAFNRAAISENVALSWTHY